MFNSPKWKGKEMKGKLTERFMRIHLISLWRHEKYGTDFS